MEKKSTYDKLVLWLKNNKVIAIFVLLTVLYLGLSQVIEATKKNKDILFGSDDLVQTDSSSVSNEMHSINNIPESFNDEKFREVLLKGNGDTLNWKTILNKNFTDWTENLDAVLKLIDQFPPSSSLWQLARDIYPEVMKHDKVFIKILSKNINSDIEYEIVDRLLYDGLLDNEIWNNSSLKMKNHIEYTLEEKYRIDYHNTYLGIEKKGSYEEFKIQHPLHKVYIKATTQPTSLIIY